MPIPLFNRLASIFGGGMPTFPGSYQTPPFNPSSSPIAPNFPTDINFGMGQQQEDEEDWIGRRIAELYQPQNTMQQIVQQMFANMPQRTEPGRWRKIGAAIAGMGTENPYESAQTMAYGPYNMQMKDWEARLDPAMKGAQLEAGYNQNARIMAEQTLQRELQRRRDIETERKNRASEELRARSETTREKRAAVYAFKAQNPNWEFKTQADGSIVAINPQDPTRSINTGIQSNELSDADKLALQLDMRLKVAERQGQIAKENIAATAAEARTTKATPPGRAPAPESAIERMRARSDRAQQARIEHPEWAKFIGIGSNNEVVIMPPGRNGPTAAVYKQIEQYMSGTGGGISPTGLVSGAKSFGATPTGKTMMTSPDGKRGYVPNNQVEAALAQGYKKVQ